VSLLANSKAPLSIVQGDCAAVAERFQLCFSVG